MIKNWLKRQAAERQTIRELQSLSNRDLVDIGVTREEIRRVAKDHASFI